VARFIAEVQLYVPLRKAEFMSARTAASRKSTFGILVLAYLGQVCGQAVGEPCKRHVYSKLLTHKIITSAHTHNAGARMANYGTASRAAFLQDSLTCPCALPANYPLLLCVQADG
jgi:hypothetical protein